MANMRQRYAPKKLPINSQRQVFFDSCLLGLKSWYYALPVELKPGQPGSPNTCPQAYVLCMVYHTAIILLAKPYLGDSRDGRHSPVEKAQPPGPSTRVQKAPVLYMEAAKDICSLGDQYREVFGSFRRSPITATHCTLLAALALLNPPPQGDLDSGFGSADMDKVKACLQTLQELSESWVPPRKYHRSLERMIHARTGSRRVKGSTQSTTAEEHRQPLTEFNWDAANAEDASHWDQIVANLDWSIGMNPGAMGSDWMVPREEGLGLPDVPLWPDMWPASVMDLNLDAPATETAAPDLTETNAFDTPWDPK